MEAEGEGEDQVTDRLESEQAVSVIASDLTEEDEIGAPIVVEDITASAETIPAVHSYQIKPSLIGKFKAEPVKEIIRDVLSEILTGKVYDSESVKKWIIKIANDINNKVRELNMKRYKHVVQITLGEYKGAGVKSGVRCLWDSETDGYTSDIYFNDTIFCLAVVYGIYLY